VEKGAILPLLLAVGLIFQEDQLVKWEVLEAEDFGY
jgi:hypothetical protein